MKTIDGMLIKFFLPIFFIALAFFILVFELMDVFSNLWRYISYDVSFGDMGRIALLFLPKCISYSLPIALLFSGTFVLGSFYMNNELISVFGSGICLYRFVTPLLAAGVILSIAGFFFDEYIVIETYKSKNRLFQQVVKQTVSYSNSNVTVISGDNLFIYQVNYYNDRQMTFSGLILIERDREGRFVRRVDAEHAEWNGSHWIMHNCRVFSWSGNDLIEEQAEVLDSDRYSEEPVIFRRVTRKIDEMAVQDARAYIEQLKKAGLPYQEALSEYHGKFSFALTPLIVVLVSSSIGGLFKKNILLMSLLSSLSIVVVYYVMQMVAMTLSRNGYLPPLAGAWTSFILLLGIGLGLFKLART